MAKSVSITKPKRDTKQALNFAEAKSTTVKKEPKGSGLVPDGDVRLTANIRQSLHIRLKVQAAKECSTIGELVERLIDENVP